MKFSTWYMLAAALFLGAAGLSDRVRAEKDVAPSLSEIMRKLNGGTNSMTRNLELDLKEDEPDWEAIQESTAEYTKLVASLQKGTPRKGDKASWEKLAREFGEIRALAWTP